MIKTIKKILDLEQGRFVIVGVMNTIIGAAAMLIAYNVFHMGYWLSSAMDYIIGSIFSYFANKHFTFKAKRKSKSEVVRFAINILVCYLLAYGIARPVMDIVLKDITLSEKINAKKNTHIKSDDQKIFLILNFLLALIIIIYTPNHYKI